MLKATKIRSYPTTEQAAFLNREQGKHLVKIDSERIREELARASFNEFWRW
jgi:hypothetical protein